MKSQLIPATAIQKLRPSYIREILQAASSGQVISLAGGLPSPSSFPLALMSESLASLQTQPALFQYGETSGYAPLREHLKTAYQLNENQDLLITTGSQQGLDLIARSFINPSDHIALEAPSYLGALQVFELAQAHIHGIEQTTTGPNLEQLKSTFEQFPIKFFYAVPDFHNPTGLCWTQSVRDSVARLCNQYNVTLIEDAPYRDIRFSGEPLPLVSAQCDALVLRSFSKLAAPGMRIGAVYGDKEAIKTLIKVKQACDLHSNVPMQKVLLDFLQHEEFEKHINKVCSLYKKQATVLRNAITLHLPNTVFEPVSGGMFLWLTIPDRLPENIDTFAQTLLNKGVAVVPSSVFYPANYPLEKQQAAVRLNFSHSSKTALVEAVKCINQCLNESC